MTLAPFTLSTHLALGFDDALAQVRAQVAEAGFGILTEIDVSATLRTKLGVEIEPQIILGACRPELAHRALQADPRIAALLPCNVVVAADGERTRVEVLDPGFMAQVSDDAALAEVAGEARTRLTQMLETLQAQNPEPTR